MAAVKDIPFNYLTKFLQDWGSAVVSLYKERLNNRDYQIARTIEMRIEHEDYSHTIIISLEDYWKWIEHGRKPGKFPPPPKIEKWIRDKSIQPRQPNITTKQLTYLIGRKIAKEGIKPKNLFAESVKEAGNFQRGAKEAIQRDVTAFLEKEATLRTTKNIM